MIKMIMAGGLFLIAAIAAPLYSSALDSASQRAALNESQKALNALQLFEEGHEVAVKEGAIMRKKKELANKLKRLGFQPYQYCETVGCPPPNQDHYVLTFQRKKCAFSGCKVNMYVDGIFKLVVDGKSSNKPTAPSLTVVKSNGSYIEIKSTSIEDFMTKTCDTSLIESMIAELNGEHGTLKGRDCAGELK